MSDLDGLSGSALRTKLEEALAALNEAQEENRSLRVAALVGREDLNLVKEADLAGVEPSELEDHAKQIQKDRAEEQVALLMRGGLDKEAAEKVVAGQATEAEADADDAAEKAITRIRTAGKVGGGEKPPVTPDTEFKGRAALVQHFAAKEAEGAK